MGSNISVTKLVSNLLTSLDERQRQVLEYRYGLKDGNSQTLAEIGERYKITRERVRQIEAGALQAVKKIFTKNGANEFVKLVKGHLKNLGGVRRGPLFLSDLRYMIADSNAKYLDSKVHFILDVANEPKFELEDAKVYSYWYLTEDDRKKATGFVSKLVKSMEAKRGTLVAHKDVDSLFVDAVKPHNLKDLVALNYIAVSKQFCVNQYGDFGLSHWSEANPQTIRDWSYLVLKKHQKPVHFQDIAKMINKVRRDKEKLAHPQTVHNELIKDSRFVLVGRGTYGLQEFGFMPGTARQVMGRLLKKHGALKPKELLDFVLKERVFKKNTITINLQNRKHFKRLEDGRYTLV